MRAPRLHNTRASLEVARALMWSLYCYARKEGGLNFLQDLNAPIRLELPDRSLIVCILSLSCKNLNHMNQWYVIDT